MTIDLDYAMKRLIRGLSSSRDSARHGFSACFTALLTASSDFPKDKELPLSVTMPIIDESTRIKGKVRGSEERDLMFGKLFAYLSIARSGILRKDDKTAVDILERLIELHKKRGWMREVVTEAILVVLYSMNISSGVVASRALPIIAGAGLLSPVDAETGIRNDSAMTGGAEGWVREWVPWQLALALGLIRYGADSKEIENAGNSNNGKGKQYKDIRKAVGAMVPSLLDSSAGSEGEKLSFHQLLLPSALADKDAILGPCLVAAASGFPKIHRVWEYVLGGLFGLPIADEYGGVNEFGLLRALPSARVQQMSDKQVDLLKALVMFMERNLLVR